MAKPLSFQQKQEVLRLAGQKVSQSEIARRIGCSRPTVGRILARDGVADRPARGRQINVRMSEKEDAALRKMAEAHGLSRSEMIRYLVRSGSGVVDLRGAEVEVLRESSNQLNAMARNLVQVLQLARSGRLNWNKRDGALVAGLVDRTEAVARAFQSFRAASARGAFVRVEDIGGGISDG